MIGLIILFDNLQLMNFSIFMEYLVDFIHNIVLMLESIMRLLLEFSN